jgi:AraC family transcriptional regulator of adaptative response / DNA-3-methyladenine glycosylase II
VAPVPTRDRAVDVDVRFPLISRPATRQHGQVAAIPLDDEACYGAVLSRDARFDGWFVTAVRTTGIYCRPSCPAITPKRANVTFHRSAAAAQLAGYRACKRCRPDASPGSPAWNGRADVVARAMRLIADGVVDREGVAGLAAHLHYSARHVDRLLRAEVGAGPLALARAQRAQTARMLIETTTMPFGDVAFAAGFASVRQFNETVRAVFADSPSSLRVKQAGRAVGGRAGTGAGGADLPGDHGRLSLRLPFRAPFDAPAAFAFLAARAIPGVERSFCSPTGSVGFSRVLDLPHGPAVVQLVAEPGDRFVRCSLRMADWRDLTTAVTRCRRLLDLDADPVAVDAALGADPLLGPLVTAHPGRRAPGFADGAEGLVRALVGQQVSVAGARTTAGRLAAAFGTPLPTALVGRDDTESPGRSRPADPPGADLTVVFPTSPALAGLDPDTLPMPRRRARALVDCARSQADEDLVIDVGADPDELRRQLLTVSSIGPWTADYVVMRALGHPDVFLTGDLGVRAALARLGGGTPGSRIDPQATAVCAAAWRPWRSYAVHHLWGSLDAGDDPATPSKEHR